MIHRTFCKPHDLFGVTILDSYATNRQRTSSPYVHQLRESVARPRPTSPDRQQPPLTVFLSP